MIALVSLRYLITERQIFLKGALTYVQQAVNVDFRMLGNHECQTVTTSGSVAVESVDAMLGIRLSAIFGALILFSADFDLFAAMRFYFLVFLSLFRALKLRALQHQLMAHLS